MRLRPNKPYQYGLMFVGALLPWLAHAQQQLPFEGTLFDTLYTAATQQVDRDEMPQPESVKFVISQIDERLEGRFKITEADVRNAIRGNTAALCADPVRQLSGTTECLAFRDSIIQLVAQEREIQQLADNLLAYANGSEPAVSDEPHRPLAVAPAALMFTSLWAGTGATARGWPQERAVETAFNQLKSALAVESDTMDQVVMRFHFGVMRSLREDSAGGTSGLEEYGGATQEALLALASALGVDESRASAETLAEFAAPSLEIPNVELWAREDDIGLMYVYPTHLPRFDIRPASQSYPWHYQDETSQTVGYTLAYPFRYRGLLPLVPPGTRSPLCARVSARNGYLCRPLSSDNAACVPGETVNDDGTIAVRTCNEQSIVVEEGPAICSGSEFTELFTLTNPDGGTRDPMSVCVPRTETTFESTIVSNACYVGWCVKETLDDHTLLGGRNPIVAGEPAQPYLACMREDPHLGIHAELPPVSSSVIPQYLGHDLVRALEHAYCGIVGQVPSHGGIVGLCDFTPLERLALPFQIMHDTLEQGLQDDRKVDDAQSIILAGAAAAGQRQALDQSLPAYNMVARGMAQTIQAIADLYKELQKAPLTTTACPWNGELKPEHCGTQPNSE